MPPRNFSLVSLTCLLLGLFGLVSSYAKLSNAKLEGIPEAGDDFHIKEGALLAPILVPRVPGTPGSDAVLHHLVNFFRRSLPEWKLEFQNSSATTPTSGGQKVPFRNLIAFRDPPGAQPGSVGRLTMVAHYDSLATVEGFVSSDSVCRRVSALPANPDFAGRSDR